MTRLFKTLILGVGVLILLTHVATMLPETSVRAAQTTCDLCGKCGDMTPPDHDECMACLYENPDNPTSKKERVSWTIIGCLETTPGGFVQQMLVFATATVGGVIFIVLLYGGFLLLTSTGDPEKISQGKTLIRSSIIALLLILFSVFILSVIGFDILKIPGMEGT